jgi:hypothetical protein
VDGAVPFGTEVGYEAAGKERWLYAKEDGDREFEAPIGDVVVIAKAPGFPTVRRPLLLSAGVPEEVVLVLEPAR